ncbi:MAG TPA: prolyl aminopeptidase [Acidiferrobacterales bacterium]|nr:prolyl aminopeptidase [Acidiferrobacterales bacterium]
MTTRKRVKLYAALEPYAHGRLPVGHGHELYYEQCGNPAGAPAVVLHGGPGSGCSPTQRRFFDPAYYRVVLFDQRGCGRSRPSGATQWNTTQDLIADMEQLRAHLNINRWLVFGGSWGSTLGLAYAQAYPQAVAGMILRAIFLATPEELDWYLVGLQRFIPEAWNRLAAWLPELERADLLAAYYRRVHGASPEHAMSAARGWSAYETAVIGLNRTAAAETAVTGLERTAAATGDRDESLLASVKIHTHYLMRHCFLEPDQLMRGLGSIRSLPAVIIQGRRDMMCPPATAYRLHGAWPEASLVMVAQGGHLASSPPIAGALVTATERFKQVVTAGSASR